MKSWLLEKTGRENLHLVDIPEPKPRSNAQGGGMRSALGIPTFAFRPSLKLCKVKTADVGLSIRYIRI